MFLLKSLLTPVIRHSHYSVPGRKTYQARRHLYQRPTQQRHASNATFETFEDRYETLDEVQNMLRVRGLESSNLIIGVDYTKEGTSFLPLQVPPT